MGGTIGPTADRDGHETLGGISILVGPKIGEERPPNQKMEELRLEEKRKVLVAFHSDSRENMLVRNKKYDLRFTNTATSNE